MRSSNPFRKPMDAWRVTEDGIHLEYPIFYYETTIPDEVSIKRSLKEVVSDVDFWGWERDENGKIVDSSGKVFIAKFKKHQGFSLFKIPTEYWSGIFPGEVERIMEISEIKKIMISGIERNATRIEEDLDILKQEVNSMDSVREIISKCAVYL